MKQQYHFNENNIYVGSSKMYKGDVSPANNATLQEPPFKDLKENQAFKFKDNNWLIVHDYTNAYIYNINKKQFEYGEIWESIPSHIKTDKPLCYLDQDNILTLNLVHGCTPLWIYPPTKTPPKGKAWQYDNNIKNFVEVYDLRNSEIFNKTTAQKEHLSGFTKTLEPHHTLKDPSILQSDQIYAKFDHDDNKWIVDIIKKDKALKDQFLSKRDNLLSQSDKILVADFPISKSDLKQVKEWRTHLRDVTKTSNYHKKPMPPTPTFLIPNHIKQ